ncbi:MAG: hypothetical protein K2P78_14570 [Gemmataceae bacterium]|nr:hypothetical protein [Gemmataceae bacterium]
MSSASISAQSLGRHTYTAAPTARNRSNHPACSAVDLGPARRVRDERDLDRQNAGLLVVAAVDDVLIDPLQPAVDRLARVAVQESMEIDTA